MSSPRHSRSIALALSLVPGWGHVYLGRERRGLALFTLTAVLAFLSFNLILVYAGEYRMFLARAAAIAAGLVWIAGIVEVWQWTAPRRLRETEERKAAFLRSGMVAYLRGELDGAEEDFRACLRLDVQDPEAILRLGVVAARRGQIRQARRLLRRAGLLDLDEKWHWEISREIQSLRGVEPKDRLPAAQEVRKPGGNVPAGGASGRKDAREPSAAEAAGTSRG